MDQINKFLADIEYVGVEEHKLVINRANNLGDTMCQMRCLKEFKDRNPGLTLDFVTSEYLHCYAALHTDLFENIAFKSKGDIAVMIEDVDPSSIIEFSINWQRACDIGILKAWGEKTLGFIPSTDKPYFIIQPHEMIVAKANADKLRTKFRKLVVLQFNTPSGYVRSFKVEDWNKILSFFPSDVGLIYPGPIELSLISPLKKRENLILLPGYDIGTTVALMKHVDYVFGAHGGTIMMAHAAGKKEVTQVMFLAACAPGILDVPEWDTLCYPDHEQVDWDEIQKTIKRRLS